MLEPRSDPEPRPGPHQISRALPLEVAKEMPDGRQSAQEQWLVSTGPLGGHRIEIVPCRHWSWHPQRLLFFLMWICWYPPVHRMMTHSLAAAAITHHVAGRTMWSVSFVCGAAYASHLLLDWLGGDVKAPAGIQNCSGHSAIGGSFSKLDRVLRHRPGAVDATHDRQKRARPVLGTVHPAAHRVRLVVVRWRRA